MTILASGQVRYSAQSVMARYASGSEESASGRKERESMTGAINRLIGYAVGIITMYIIMRVTGRGGKNE